MKPQKQSERANKTMTTHAVHNNTHSDDIATTTENVAIHTFTVINAHNYT